MQAWFCFWMTAIAVSAVLFFGVALLVAIFGWRDLRDLYNDLEANRQAADALPADALPADKTSSPQHL